MALSALIGAARDRGWRIDCALDSVPVSVADAWSSAPDLAFPHFCQTLEVLYELRLVDLTVARADEGDKDNYWRWLFLLFKCGVKTIGLFKDPHLAREAIVRLVKDSNIMNFCIMNERRHFTMSEEFRIRWANLVVKQTEQVKQKKYFNVFSPLKQPRVDIALQQRIDKLLEEMVATIEKKRKKLKIEKKALQDYGDKVLRVFLETISWKLDTVTNGCHVSTLSATAMALCPGLVCNHLNLLFDALAGMELLDTKKLKGRSRTSAENDWHWLMPLLNLLAEKYKMFKHKTFDISVLQDRKVFEAVKDKCPEDVKAIWEEKLV